MFWVEGSIDDDDLIQQLYGVSTRVIIYPPVGSYMAQDEKYVLLLFCERDGREEKRIGKTGVYSLEHRGSYTEMHDRYLYLI